MRAGSGRIKIKIRIKIKTKIKTLKTSHSLTAMRSI